MQEMHIDPSLKLEAPPWEMLQLLGFDFYKRKELSFYIDCGVFVKCDIEGFQFVANTDFNFSLQVNFVVCQLFALLAAVWFRTYLHSSKTSSFIRHVVATLLGLYLAFFCFGW